ncbi:MULTISPECIES: helix-turn-helix transcriptional regulator [Brevibacterium]|uniref:YafY family protein n=2 Tax=Brevibacterium TaxID=1696 RepID=A0ABP9U417_9MICO
MRADRLVSLVLLLRQRGRMTADALAAELEVSTRTILRDIDALSLAGVPVFAERGRHGGFALLPGFRTELTGLSHDETLALVASGLPNGHDRFGLAPALGSGMLKLLDALPASHRGGAAAIARRILVEPEADLLARPRPAEEIDAEVMTPIRLGVVQGCRLRLDYGSADSSPRWRTVDPIGLVTSRGRGYLLALSAGEDRTYRLSRVRAAQLLAEEAQRTEDVDLAALWAERSDRFRRSGAGLTVTVRTDEAGAAALYETAVDRSALTAVDGGVEVVVRFQDAEHAEWALWLLGDRAEVIAPDSLRHRLGERAQAMAQRYC